MRFELGPADEIPNTFNMWFTMQGNKEIHREYLVYDPLDFIGTVGGTLGLFVGFSFFGLWDIVEYLSAFVKKFISGLRRPRPISLQSFPRVIEKK